MGSRDAGRDTPLGSNRLIPVINGSGAAIPMGGIVWLDDEFAGAMSAKQPDADTHPWFVAQAAIADGGRNMVSGDYPLWAAYDTGEATPAVDDEIGPENGSFYLVPTGTGFIALTAGADGLVLIREKGNTSDVSLKLGKLSSGQTLSGASPSVGATFDVYTGSPGSEADSTDNLTVYGGRQLRTGDVINDTEWLIVGRLNNEWQLVGRHWNARNAHATLTGTMTTSESAKVVTLVRTWDGTAVTGNVTAYNVPDPNGPDPYMFEGLSGDLCYLSFDPENAKWWFVWVECGAAAAAVYNHPYQQYATSVANLETSEFLSAF